MPGTSHTRDRALVGRIGTLLCAIPVEHVVETMRPLPIEPLGDAPRFVRGLAVIRGVPTLVFDTAALLGVAHPATTRFVVVRAGDRRLALAFDEVLSLRPIAATELSALPPLVSAAGAQGVAAIGTADRALLVVLEAARLIPADAWAAIDARRAAR